ncbi:MAG: ATP-binding protein [Archaeoglobales archaeon]|nr:ATP-binding protein [Archaeoglobales archaeon]
MENVGLVFGEASISEFKFIVNPFNSPKFGEYVVAKNSDGEDVLGIVRKIKSFNRLMLEEEFSYEYLVKNIGYSKSLLEKNEVTVAVASILGVVKDCTIKPNRSSIKPNSEVRLADSEMLKKILSFEKGSIEIGKLIAREDVSVPLDVKQLLLRHFAVLSITGGGKSNTVAVIVNDIVRNLNGTVILIDPHGEYLNFVFEDGSEYKKNVVPAGIRPEQLEPWEFASLVGVENDAPVQRMHLERIFSTAKAMKKSGQDLVKFMLDKIEEWIEAANKKASVEYYDSNNTVRTTNLDKQDVVSLSRIKEYVSTFFTRYEDLLQQKDMLASLKPHYLNIVNLSGFDENQMRVVVGYLLRNLLVGRISYLRGRKNWENICPAIRKPLMVIFEEAHIFAHKGSNNEVTLWMSRIAREGRKFGIGMGLISQRPKRLNEDILSQCNTKIVLKILEPSDQRYVQQASEHLSEDLLADIASLGVGEAVIVGPAVKMPVAVKIRKFNGKYGGGDMEVLDEWMEKSEDFNLEDLAI